MELRKQNNMGKCAFFNTDRGRPSGAHGRPMGAHGRYGRPSGARWDSMGDRFMGARGLPRAPILLHISQKAPMGTHGISVGAYRNRGCPAGYHLLLWAPSGRPWSPMVAHWPISAHGRPFKRQNHHFCPSGAHGRQMGTHSMGSRGSPW